MVEWNIADGTLHLHLRGADRLWALRSSLEIPLAHIAGVCADPPIAHEFRHGLKELGTSVPGLITAGLFRQDGKQVFWDVHYAERTIGIALHDERLDELVVEVEDPAAAVAAIQLALAAHRR